MNIPKLRFKEFTDEWQRNSLNKLTTYVDYRGKTPQKTDNGIFLVTAKNIKMGYIDYEISKEYISENDFNDVMKRGFVQKGDVLFTTEAPMGNVAQIYNEHIALAQRVIKFRGIPLKLKNTFLKYNLMSFRFQKLLKEKAIGTTVLGIQGKVLHKLPIIYPQLKEQEKIADFLSTVDKKITNLENTITSLENQKKGLLQQIFSQKLRFKDENGNNYPNWKEKLFSEIFSFLSTNSYSRAEMNEYHGTVKNIHYGDVLIKFNHIIDLSKHQLPYLINYNSIPKKILKEQLNKQLIKNGDIIIADTAEDYTAGKVCEVINVNDNLIVSGLHTMLCRPKPNLFSLGFLGYFMNSYTYHHQLLKLITGTKVYSIIKKEIIKTKILIPCLEEQTKIADFLSTFDRKLDNQKAQLEHWQQIKKGLLQQMFV